MVKKVYPREVCMICVHPIAECACPKQSRKKRLVRVISQDGKPRIVEDVEISDGSA